MAAAKAKKTPKPQCLAIIICEGVIEDLRSRNRSIINTFNGITANKFPTRQDRLTVFFSLTDGYGEQPLRIELQKDDGSPPVFGIDGKIKFKSPLDIVEAAFDLRGVPLPSEGHYAVKLYVNSSLIAERRLHATVRAGADPSTKEGAQ